MNHCPRLIEVALPIREISAESVRDKSLRHGHISTLHLWWARRPLAAARGIVFASLVPDPDDPQCPSEFRKAVERLLRDKLPSALRAYRRGREWIPDADPYRPYDGIPDTPRNRLLTFIAKWSPEKLAFDAGKNGKQPKPAELLDDRSLVKWETSDPENPQGREVLRIARELIAVAHQCSVAADVRRLTSKSKTEGQNKSQSLLTSAATMPVVLDPFAGGGAIPLEATRLGCQAIANDYNPVAYLILRATCEFPQKYGQRLPDGSQRLVRDVEHWARWILERVRQRIGHLYPCLPAGRRRAPDEWEEAVPAGRQGKFYAYVLQCKDGSFYKGQTDNMPRRLREHDEGLVEWTAARRPVYLVYWESFDSRQEAVEREKYLKSGSGCEWLAQKLGEPEKVVGYLWARTAPCSNPACRAQIPLLRSLLICDKEGKKVALTMKVVQPDRAEENSPAFQRWAAVSQQTQVPPGTKDIAGEMRRSVVPDGTLPSASSQPSVETLGYFQSSLRDERPTIVFGIARGKDIKREEGTMLNRGDCRCPICQQTTPVKDLRRAGVQGKMGERMVAVITDTSQGKAYRAVEPADLQAFEEGQQLAKNVERPNDAILPEITGNDDDEKVSNSTGIRVHLYGFKTWGSLFNDRQLLAMHTFVECLRDALAEIEKEKHEAGYHNSIAAYLGLWVSRNSARWVSFGRWDAGYEKFQTPFDMAKVSMVWDYSEVNPLNEVTGGASGQIEWILRFIRHEATDEHAPKSTAGIHAAKVLRGDGARLALDDGSLDVVVTDPPYFDEIAYADLSDLFYAWQKRALSDVFPENFSTPRTPKGDEATALRHRHGGSEREAEQHFTSKLAACFAEAKRVCKHDGIITVMFAHQTTEAWTALVKALFEAGLNIDATYPIDTELKNRARGLESSALETSITVICRPREVGAAASFKDVRREIQEVVRESVRRFWDYGFRGADLIVACYGPAVGVFGKHERVERADGTPVDVPTLLELARESALKAIAGEFQGDELSRLYFVWANQYGIAPQSFDDLVKVAQMGTDSENAADLARQRGLFVVDGPTCRLALLRDRTEKKGLGEETTAPLIDKLHHALHLWKAEKRGELVGHLAQHELMDDSAFWKLAQALFEVLPRTEEDWKLVSALLSERESLHAQAKRAVPTPAVRGDDARQEKLKLTR